MLAGLVTGLEVLCVEILWIGEGVFRRIVEANKRLRKLSVFYDGFDEYVVPPEDAVVSVIADVSQCHMLNEVVVVNPMLPAKSAKISDACVTFRGRAIDIAIYRDRLGHKKFFP